MIILAHRYADKAEEMAAAETDAVRKSELQQIAAICRRVPEFPPQTFQEALQMIWFYQLGGILMENPLSLNPGRFDQYMYPYYRYDIDNKLHDDDGILELIECYWLKLSEWVWTISANTADFFAGYNQFQNLTVGGSDRYGKDATNELSYLALKATAEVKTHQPGLSVRISQNSPKEFVDAVMDLVALGTGFPAIHSDKTGYQMLKNLGYDTEDARDWNNCGCVVPHFRKTFEWTSTVNVNFSGAFEYATNGGKSRMTGKQMGLPIYQDRKFASYEDVEKAFMEQFDNLIDISVTGTLIAQRLQKDMIPRPYFSALFEDCLEKGKDLVDGGAKYNVGPVLTGIGLAESANSLAAIKKLVFEDKSARWTKSSTPWTRTGKATKNCASRLRTRRSTATTTTLSTTSPSAFPIISMKKRINTRIFTAIPLRVPLWAFPTSFRPAGLSARRHADARPANRFPKAFRLLPAPIRLRLWPL